MVVLVEMSSSVWVVVLLVVPASESGSQRCSVGVLGWLNGTPLGAGTYRS